MPLVPTSGVLSTVTKVANADPGTADLFVQLTLFEAMADLYDDAWDEIEPAVTDYMQDQVAKARSSLLRTTVGKALDGERADTPDEVLHSLMVLDAYTEVAKDGQGLVGNLLALFNQQHPRDSKGRFIRANTGRSTSREQPVGPRNQGYTQEVASTVGRWKNSGIVSDDTEVVLHFRRVDDKGNSIGRGAETTLPTTVGRAGQQASESLMDYDRAGEPRILSGVSVDRNSLNRIKGPQRRAAMDMMAAMAGDDVDMGAVNAITAPLDNKQNWSSQAESWNRPTSTRDGQVDRQSFRRMQTIGQTLNAVSTPGSTMNTIGGVAALVGDLGPEAEKVLGPGMRRTAYRYRGTERRANKDLVQDMESVGQSGVRAITQATGDAYEQVAGELASVMQDSALARGGSHAGQRMEDVAAERVLGHWHAQSRVRTLSDDQVAMRTRGDIGTTTLLDSVPTMEETQLSVAAGELPPSIGVMIDSDGDVVSQAQGFNGDHYLPFDLKNLKRLRGGQYVRTRAAGGPTTEDFYTALMTGARQFDVVSNSGVFTVEFDPDVRGGRRYSDRALRMVQRYGQMLEAISSDSSNLFLTDLPAATKAQIRRDALAEAGSNKDRFKQIYDERLAYERFKSEVSPEDYEELEATVDEVLAREVEDHQQRNRGARMSRTAMSERRRELMTQMITEEQTDKVRRLQLDGPGYYRAMRTLQQEFPFFIREVDFANVPDWLARRNLTKDRRFRQFAPTDSGYTRPGQVTSSSAQRHGAYQVNGARRERATEQVEGEQKQGTGFTSGASGSTPTQASSSSPASASGAAKAPQTLAAATSADNSQMKRKMSTGLAHMHSAVSAVAMNLPPIESSASMEEALASGPIGALILHSQKAGVKHGEAGAKLADWILNKATPDELALVKEGLDSELIPTVERQIQQDPGWLPTPSYRHQDVKDLSTLLGLLSMNADGGDITTRPADIDPRPLRFDDLPQSTSLSDYDNALKSWSAEGGGRDPVLAETVIAMESLSPEGRVRQVSDAVDDVEELREAANSPSEVNSSQAMRTLERRQKAWSFLANKQAAKTLISMGIAKPGDADPKDVSKTAGSRRQVVVRKQEPDPVLDRLRQLVGL